LKLIQIDAFTSEAFRGNPAAVCLLDRERDAAWMQNVAADYDFVSRFFAPGSGVDEDPVTGSAHCALTPFWVARLGRNELRAYQASPRGGALRVRLDGDRVKLAGRAVTVLRGELLV
jgi:predicted PhzF superfamily epimerase YddE/YHI9